MGKETIGSLAASADRDEAHTVHPHVSRAQYSMEPAELSLFVDESSGRILRLSPDAESLLAALFEEPDVARARARVLGGDAGADEARRVDQALEELDRQGALLRDELLADRRQRLRAEHDRARFEELRRTLEYASREVPYYRDRFEREKVGPSDVRAPSELRRIPLLLKEDLRQHFPDGFIPDDIDAPAEISCGKLAFRQSSGTAYDERVQVLQDRVRRAWSQAAGVLPYFKDLRRLARTRSPRLGRFAPLNCTGISCVRDLPAMDSRSTGKMLLMIPAENPAAPTPREVKKFFSEVEAYGVDWLYADPVYLTLVTSVALDHGIEIPPVKLISTCFEFLCASHRRLLSEAWKAPVHMVYAMTEIGGFDLHECPRGAIHINEGYEWWEILRDGEPVASGELGHLVLTPLHHRVPLVRFVSEDLVRAGGDEICACGSISRTLASYDGRAKDALLDEHGNFVTVRDVDEALSKVEDLTLYQVTQGDSWRELGVRMMSASGASERRIAADARDALRELFGPEAKPEVSFGGISPERSGKFRLTQSKLVDHPRRFVTELGGSDPLR